MDDQLPPVATRQRGNVTLITALTVMLMTLMVLMSTGLAQTGSGSNNMQASADAAALAAAEGFLASLNDQAFLDSIQWGIDAVANLGHAITVVAAVLAASAAALTAATLGLGAGAAALLAAAAAVLFPIGASITAVGNTIKGAVDAIFSVLRSIISVVKWIASELNSALMADGNGYNGFMIPVDIGDAPGAKLSAADIKNKAETVEQAVVDYPTVRSTDEFPKNLTTLKDTIRLQGLTYFWRDQRPPAKSEPNAKDNKPVSVRAQAVYHIFDNEKSILLDNINEPFKQELDQLTRLRAQINEPDEKKNRFDKSSGDVAGVNKVLDRVIGELKETIDGGSQPDPSCEPLPDISNRCPEPYTANPVSYIVSQGNPTRPWGFGSVFHRNNSQWVDDAVAYFNKSDKGQACPEGKPVPGGPPPAGNPVHNFVYTDTSKATAYEKFSECPLPSVGDGPPDIRSHQEFGQTYGGDAGAYATYIRDANKTIKGKTSDKDDGKRHLTFLEFKALDPTLQENLTGHLTGRDASGRFAIAISQVDVLLAKDHDDKISFKATCSKLFPGKDVNHTTLGFIPDNEAAICAAIADSLIKTADFVNKLPYGMKELATAIFGEPPEVRTYHAVPRHIPSNEYICEAVNIIKGFTGTSKEVLQHVISLIWSIVKEFAFSSGDNYSQKVKDVLAKYNCNANGVPNTS